MNKEQLEYQLQEARNEHTQAFKDYQKYETGQRLIRIEPLREEIKRIEAEIRQECDNLFKPRTTAANAKIKAIQADLDFIKIAEAKEWCEKNFYPVGTVLVEWYRRSSIYPWHKTGKKVIVQVYDGSQALAGNLSDYRKPDKGQIVLFYTKKDGSMGTQIAAKSRHENFSIWGTFLPENEQPKQ